MENTTKNSGPSEEDILVEILKVQERDVKHIRELLLSGRWARLCRLTDYHGAIPLLYRMAEKIEDSIDTESFQMLKNEYHEIASLNLTLSAHLLMFTQRLKERGLHYIAIKGPTLSQELYGDITMRQFSDIDLFVAQEDMRVISDIALSLGYEPMLPLTLLERKKFFELDNDFSFRHRVSDLKMELHWKLFPDRHRMPLSFPLLYRNSRVLLLQKREVTVLSPEDNLLYLSLHGAKHIFERLIWICDIDRLIRHCPDMELMDVYRRAVDIQVEEPFLLGIFLSHKLFDTPLPDTMEQYRTAHVDRLVEKTIHSYREGFIFQDEADKKYARFLFLAELHQSRRSRLFSLFVSLFKPTAVDVITLQLPNRWDFLYPLLRPFRLLSKYASQMFKGAYRHHQAQIPK
jgi:hypothetical protein